MKQFWEKSVWIAALGIWLCVEPAPTLAVAHVTIKPPEWNLLSTGRWIGKGQTRGNTAIEISMTFDAVRKTAAASLFWPAYQKTSGSAAGLPVTLRRPPVMSSNYWPAFMEVTGSIPERHVVYNYKERSKIYCHILVASFLRIQQFRCKLAYTDWIVMHRPGKRVVPMPTTVPPTPPTLKGNLPSGSGSSTPSPAATIPTPAGLMRYYGSRYLNGCWREMRISRPTLAHYAVFRTNGIFRWAASQGKWKAMSNSVWLLDSNGKTGTKWDYYFFGPHGRRTGSPTRLVFTNPEAFRYLGSGKYLYFRFASTRTQTEFAYVKGSQNTCP